MCIRDRVGARDHEHGTVRAGRKRLQDADGEGRGAQVDGAHARSGGALLGCLAQRPKRLLALLA